VRGAHLADLVGPRNAHEGAHGSCAVDDDGFVSSNNTLAGEDEFVVFGGGVVSKLKLGAVSRKSDLATDGR
jgi:hypothetical protein